MATSSGMLSEVYVSSAIEATAGVAATLNKRLLLKSCGVNYQEEFSKIDEVTGFFNALGITREAVKAGGSIESYLRPDNVAYFLKMLYSQAPTSALVSPSTTVFEHLFDGVTTPPATFTLMKVISNISTYTEKLCGNGVTGIAIKSGKGRITMSVKVEGLGANYQQGVAKPVGVSPIFTADEDPLIGTNTNLLVDGTSITKGLFDAGWSVDIDFGGKLLQTAGSTDGSITRFDLQEMHKVTAQFTLYEANTNNIADFLAAGFHTYAFQCIGSTIDTPNSLKQLVEFKLTNARMVGELKTEIGDHGVVKLPITVEGIMNRSTGFDLTCRVRNLQASY